MRSSGDNKMKESHKLAGGLNEERASFIASPTAPESVGGSVGGNRRAFKPPLNEGQKGGVTMKYFVIALLVAPMVLFAYNPGQPLPAGATEVETWYWDTLNSQWVSQGVGDPDALARLWSSGPMNGSCNKEEWVIPITVHASIAQWIEWSISGTRWDWRVRKPGTYAGDCISATIKSNNDVLIDYDGFEDLHSDSSVTQDIPIWYGFGETLDQVISNGWVRSTDLNADDDLLLDSEDLHAGLSWKLWNKIEVLPCHSSCEYEDEATITLVLQNVKMWIDPQYGNFITPQP